MKNVNKIVNILIFFLIVLSVTLFLKYDIYEFDDFVQSFFYTFDINTLLAKADHGKYISWFFMKYICHGTSLLFNIHPNENIIPRIVIGLDFALLSYLYASLTKITSRSNYINPLIFLSAFFVSISLTLLHPDYLMRWNQHFGYILLFIILLWFMNVFISYFLNDKLPEKKDNYRNNFLLFITAISAYYNVFLLVGVFVFLIIYYYRKGKFNFKLILSDEKYSPLRIPLLIGIFSFSLVCINPNLHSITSQRTSNFNLLSTVHNYFFEYTFEWIHSMFTTPAIKVINLSILLLLSIVFIQKRKITKAMMLSVTIFISSAIFQYLLIFCGKTLAHQDFWISFPRVYLIHYYFCLIPIFLLLGEALKNREQKYCSIPFVISFLIFLYLTPLFKSQFDASKLIRREMYMIIKSEMFYSINKYPIAVIPEENIDWDSYTFYPRKINWCVIYFFRNYYLIYKQRAIRVKFVPLTEFLEIAKRDGLNFTEEELRKSDFNNFYSKDFKDNLKKAIFTTPF